MPGTNPNRHRNICPGTIFRGRRRWCLADFSPVARAQRKPLEMQRDFFALRPAGRRTMSPHHSRQNFRLRVRCRHVKRKRYPQRQSLRGLLFARNQQPAFRNIPCFTYFRLLTQWRNPPKPHRKAQTYPGMLTILHGCHVRNEPGKLDYTLLQPKPIPKLLELVLGRNSWFFGLQFNLAGVSVFSVFVVPAREDKWETVQNAAKLGASQ